MVPSGMERRTAIVVAVVLLLGAVAAIQLADPRFGERTPPEVNFSEPPEEVAADAATQFEYVDYAYRIDFRRNRTDDWRQVRTMRVDHSDREYYKTGPNGENGVVLYGTDAVTFVRPGPESKWRVTAVREVLYDKKIIGQPINTKRIRGSNASYLYQNQSVILIQVPVHSINVANHLPGNSIITIDKESGLVESVLVSYKPDQARTLHARFRLTDKNIDIDRPQEIPASPREYFWDFLRGPVFDML